MAGRKAEASSQVVRLTRASQAVRRGAKGNEAGKTSGPRKQLVGELLGPVPPAIRTADRWAYRKLISIIGEIQPRHITAAHCEVLNKAVEQGSKSPFTRQARASCIRRALLLLWQEHGASRVYERIRKKATAKPRNVTATEAEREALMSIASPHMLCFLMLCSDMAIRSGTARKLSPEHYDAAAKTLTFDTKYQNRQRLPVPRSLCLLLDQCQKPGIPFVAQLPRHNSERGRYFKYDRELSSQQLSMDWKRLRVRAGIARKLTMHDLRRTTAFKVYDATRDIRLVQALLGHSNLTSTCWYLDHHMTDIPVAILELARLNPTTEVIQ